MPINFDLSKYNNDTFIETGTFRGYGIEGALACDFDAYLSADIDKTYACINQVKFGDRDNVQIFEEHSPTFLRQQVRPELGSITFWLDAHADGSGSLNWEVGDLSDEQKCPLYEEIEVITDNVHDGSHVVMVDDVRIIEGTAWGRQDLSLDGVKARLQALPGSVEFSRENGFTKQDILIAKC